MHQELSAGCDLLCDIGIGGGQPCSDGEEPSRCRSIAAGGCDRARCDGRYRLAVLDDPSIGKEADDPCGGDGDGDLVPHAEGQGGGREGDGGGGRAGGDGDGGGGALCKVVGICCFRGGDRT